MEIAKSGAECDGVFTASTCSALSDNSKKQTKSDLDEMELFFSDDEFDDSEVKKQNNQINIFQAKIRKIKRRHTIDNLQQFMQNCEVDKSDATTQTSVSTQEVMVKSFDESASEEEEKSNEISDADNSHGVVKKIRGGADWVVNQVVSEVGWKELSKEHSYGKKFKPREKDVLGLRVSEKIYQPTDPFIEENKIRKRCTKDLKSSSGRPVFWIETAGMFELGTGFNGTFPLSNISYLETGFTVSGLISYKTTQPYTGYRKGIFKLLKNNTFDIPTSYRQAKKMCAGGEFELRGQAKVCGHGNIGVGDGLAVGPGKLGAFLSVGAKANVQREMAVNVFAIDGSRFVRLTLKDVNEETAGLNAKIQAGLVFHNGNLIKSGPQWGQGYLTYLVQKKGCQSLDSLVTNYTSLQAKVETSITRRAGDRLSFILDLNNPKAQQAYNELMRLYTVNALKLSEDPGSGINLIAMDNREIDVEIGAGATLFGAKLALAQALDGEGITRQFDDEAQKIVRNYRHHEHFSSIFVGSKDIDWESISLRESPDADLVPYFHMRFEEHDKITTQEEVDSFIHFAHSMGIVKKGEVSNDLVKMSTFKRFFSSADDTNLVADIYFNQEAIKQIDKADFEQAKMAFLQSASEIQYVYRTLPLLDEDNETDQECMEITKEYVAHKNDRFWRWMCGISTKMKEYEQEYFAPSEGRELKIDAKIYEDAIKFAKHVEKLTDINNARQVKNFLKGIAKSRGFQFMQIISALSKLAGRKNVLVHELSIHGGGVDMESVNEGKIEDPRKKMAMTMDNACERTSL